ncbi:SANT/Myb domain containing protein [Klebsormidium nitens]|uniref:SANT/Myb domain containing protein n=1 Tax=Klebsormidium nitens TaxID=105231 RepID=A0A1Y1HSR7_KLENI|nr:SANT/Myb domain containing protein [Klebsormidium nitens]|eukprot:GAQ80862.1 SANT/Myb domain containing protein [Klebsormidium nitens]
MQPTPEAPVPIHFHAPLQKAHSIVAIVGVEEKDEPGPHGERIKGPPHGGGEAAGPRESSGSTGLSTQELRALARCARGGRERDLHAETHDSSSTGSSGSDLDLPKRGRTSRSNWTKDDDAALVAFVEKHGLAQWAKAGRTLGRTGKQCRNRWSNTLEPGLKDVEWTNEEERRLVQFHRQFGSKWATLSRHMPGRSPNAIKNHWNNTIKCKEQRTSKRERCLVLRDYITSLGGTVESCHMSNPASFDWTDEPLSMDSSKLDPVRPPGEALKTRLSGWASSPLQNPPMRTESDTPSPGFRQMPLFPGECESAPETKKLKTDHVGLEEATGGQGTTAGGEPRLVRQGSRLNWIKRWAALNPAKQASVAGAVPGAVPVSVGTSVPLTDRMTENEWLRALGMVNGKETEHRIGGLAVEADLKPLTSFGGIALPLDVTSPQVFPAAGGPGQAVSLSPRKRSISDRAALEESLGWGTFPMMASAPPVVTSPYPVLGSATSGITSALVQSEDPSSLLTEIIGRPFSTPSDGLSGPGGAGGIPLPTASPVMLTAVAKPSPDQELPGGTEGFPGMSNQRNGIEEDNPLAALARSLSIEPGVLDSVKPGVSDNPQSENPVLVALVTNHLRSLLDEQAEHLKETEDAATLTPTQVVRLREQHLQIRSALSFLSSLAGIPDPLSLEADRLSGPRELDERETTLGSVTSSVIRRPDLDPGPFEPSLSPLERGPLKMLPLGDNPVNVTDPRLSYQGPEELLGVLSRGASLDARMLAQLSFPPAENFPVEQLLHGLSQGLDIPAVSEEIPLQYAPVTPATEWEPRFGQCTLDWPAESARKTDGFPAAGGIPLEALLDVPPADDTCSFLGGAEYGFPGLGNDHI